MKSLYKGFCGFAAVANQTTEVTMLALQYFIGGSPIGRIYSDVARNIQAAARELGITWEQSKPGVKQTNTMAERQVQESLVNIRVLTFHAGLPACTWPLVGPYAAFASNIKIGSDGISLYGDRFGSPFPGIRIPIGSVSYTHLTLPTKRIV